MLAQAALWVYAAHGHRLVAADLDPRLIAYVTLRGVVSAAIFALSIGIDQLSTTWAQLSWLLIPVGFAILGRLFARESAETTAEAFGAGE